MDTRRRLTETHNIALFFQGSRLGVTSAVVGSIVFALVELASALVNTYWIQKIDAPWNIMIILFSIGWVLVVIIFGSALAFFPALLLGGLLARSIGKYTLSERSAFALGSLLGAVASIMFCLPILLFEYDFIQRSGHGNFTIFIYRAIVATIIASFSGGWTGSKLVKRLMP